MENSESSKKIVLHHKADDDVNIVNYGTPGSHSTEELEALTIMFETIPKENEQHNRSTDNTTGRGR